VLSRYSNEFAFNYVFGTEFKREKKNKIKIWGFNIRSIFRGGFRERSLAIVNAGQLGVSSEFDNQLPPYFRVDLNCYLKINKVNKTSTLSLDIQNATNHQNVAYNYFDTFSREIKTQYQLGLIPILNYRIEF
jgi:outer membrane receptor protein involved in Fe transport